MLPPLLILNIMLHFNELYITEDNKCLVIDVEIDDVPEYDSCYIESIEISSGWDCTEEGNFGAFVQAYSDEDEHRRHVRMMLKKADEPIAALVTEERNNPLEGIILVRASASCDVETLVNTECGCESNEIAGAAYNAKPLYDNAVKYANNYGNTCATNDMSDFVDWLLRYYGFQFALKCGDLCQAQYYFANYLNGTAPSGTRSSNPCGCHGARR